jgi:hypothetical protein
MSVFQKELNEYPHFFLAEDERLCSTSKHCPGFPRVLYDALLHLGYDGDALIYRCRLSKTHGLDRCEVSVMILFDPAELQSRSIILTSLCEDRLTTTAALPIVLLLIQNQENPIWQQHLEVMSDLEGLQFHDGMTSLARYG